MTTKIKLSTNVSDVDVTTTAPTDGQSLVYSTSSSKWIPGAAAGGGVTVYATINDLPLSGVSTGDLALVDSTNKLYLWMDTGWYNIATINTNPSITGGNETPYILATDGTPTEITLIASDPEGIPLTWSYEVTSGSLTNGGGTTATVSNVDNVFTVTPTTTEAYAGEFSLTFKASDGVNLGTTVAAFTLAFRIPDSNYTTLLAKGVAATQNATFVDSSTNAHTVTANGDVYQGTFSPYRAGGYSMYFDGTGDYLSGSMSAVLAFGAANMTIECWVRPNTLSGIDTIYDTRVSYSTEGFSVYLENGVVTVYAGSYSNAAPLIQSPSAINTLEWTHIAVTRTSGVNRLFLNGTSVASNSNSWNQTFNASALYYIGRTDPTDRPFDGYVSNLRFVKGTAVYTANFTPPTEPLTAITNTSLLINTPYIADSSSNAHAITVNGNTSTKPFSPFDYKAYDEAINGGSAYFDGAGDYLTAGNSLDIIGNDDWTIECWAYSAADGKLVSNQDGGLGTDYISFTSIAFQFRDVSGQAYAYPPTTPNYNQWNHYAIVKNGTTFTFYLNGVGGTPSTISKTLTSRSLKIGAFLFTGFEGYFAGYMSTLRIVKGTAVYTSNFTPPTAPLTAITNTSLLLNFTNAGIQDYSQVSDLKLVGNATGSNTQTKNASYSMYFAADGTDKVSVLDTAPIHALDVGDFTIEFWVYIVSNNTYNFVVSKGSGVSSREWAVDVGPTNIRFYYTLDGSTDNEYSVTPSSIPTNTWMHIAVCNSGSSLRIFKDGSQVGTTGSLSGTVYVGSGPLELANFMGYSGIAHSLNGYIEDLRITKGLARYTANFTPPTSELLG